ncbi:NUDIX hydrolase [Sporosalibacterium faouarense]|uniref:NUDIX hydrolase n=1 Tax=Sporosalibacterium faouarense TaxID=516123 RepID=UPI001FAE830E|nr:CoA pyrophosphatase [Sporosalibacterium faouarense]
MKNTIYKEMFMDLNTIKNKIEGRNAKPLNVVKKYSVILPLVIVDGELHILYEVRSKNLNTQPGEISFPGGKVEEGENYKEAAIRETCEELNICKDDIKVLGELDYIVSPYNFKLHIYCGIIDNVDVNDIRCNKDEVDHIFTVPLNYFLRNNPMEYNIELETVIGEDFPYHLIQNGKEYNWRKGLYPVFFYEYNNYVIWGMTARFTKNFIDILNGEVK